MQATMKTTAAIAVFAFLLGGCASLQAVDAPPEQVREQVRAGQIARPGERVTVTTEDGRTHEFEVVEVTDRAVRGDGAEVPIDEIVGVRATRADPARIALAVVGAAVAVYVVYVAAVLSAQDAFLDAVLEE